MKGTPLFRCHVGSIKFPFSHAADKMTEEQATRVHNITSLCKFGEYIIVKFFELNKNDNLKLIKKNMVKIQSILIGAVFAGRQRNATEFGFRLDKPLLEPLFIFLDPLIPIQMLQSRAGPVTALEIFKIART